MRLRKHGHVTYGVGDVSGTDLADVLDSSFTTPSGGLLADDAHLGVVVAVGEVLVLFPLLACLLYGAHTAPVRLSRLKYALQSRMNGATVR